ncbi:hypothetical protein ACFYZ8_34070 [Streptomyces sp. NPDC001668]|uniref:hypothetical protein n=1 Tax=Streptomyces sp. NPDC001668 TaxID=3364598 RepID=UPI0036AB44BA
MEENQLLAAAAVTAWIVLGLVAFAAAGRILRWDWTLRGLHRHYEDLAERDPRIARKVGSAPRFMRFVLVVLWTLFLVIWPLQVACAVFIEHRWLGQGPRKTS